MKKFSLGLTIGVLVAVALSSSIAQQQQQDVVTGYVENLDSFGCGPLDQGWKQISDDLAVRLYTDDYGVRHATLGVLEGCTWQPVAVDGPGAFLPPAIPAR